MGEIDAVSRKQCYRKYAASTKKVRKKTINKITKFVFARSMHEDQFLGAKRSWRVWRYVAGPIYYVMGAQKIDIVHQLERSYREE